MLQHTVRPELVRYGVPSTPSATISEMPGPKDIARMGFTVARSLHGRWRRLAMPTRERLEPLAEDVRDRALDLRGSADPEADGRDLEQASRRLADAMIEEAAGDPEVSEIEVRDLRANLARELDRLAESSPDL